MSLVLDSGAELAWCGNTAVPVLRLRYSNAWTPSLAALLKPVLQLILMRLPEPDVVRLGATCRRLRRLCADPVVWRRPLSTLTVPWASLNLRPSYASFVQVASAATRVRRFLERVSMDPTRPVRRDTEAMNALLRVERQRLGRRFVDEDYRMLVLYGFTARVPLVLAGGSKLLPLDKSAHQWRLGNEGTPLAHLWPVVMFQSSALYCLDMERGVVVSALEPSAVVALSFLSLLETLL